MEDCRRLSTTSRFSSPGTPKIRSTPSFSSAATRRSDPFIFDPCCTSKSLEQPSDEGGQENANRRTGHAIMESLADQGTVNDESLLREPGHSQFRCSPPNDSGFGTGQMTLESGLSTMPENPHGSASFAVVPGLPCFSRSYQSFRTDIEIGIACSPQCPGWVE